MSSVCPSVTLCIVYGCACSVNGLSSVTSCQTVNDVTVRVMPSLCTDGGSYLSVCSPRSTSSVTVDADSVAGQCSSCCRYHQRHHHHHHHHHRRHPQPHSHHHHGNHVNHYQQPASYRPVFLCVFVYYCCVFAVCEW